MDEVKCLITLPANPSLGPTFAVKGPASIVGPWQRWEVPTGETVYVTTVRSPECMQDPNHEQTEHVVERDDRSRLKPVHGANTRGLKAVVGPGRKVLEELLDVLRSGTEDRADRATAIAELYLEQEA